MRPNLAAIHRVLAMGPTMRHWIPVPVTVTVSMVIVIRVMIAVSIVVRIRIGTTVSVAIIITTMIEAGVFIACVLLIGVASGMVGVLLLGVPVVTPGRRVDGSAHLRSRMAIVMVPVTVVPAAIVLLAFIMGLVS